MVTMSASTAGNSGRATGDIVESGCQMQQTGLAWRCLTHDGPEWDIAEVMGTERPCRVPLPCYDRVQLASATTTDDRTLHMLVLDHTTTVVVRVAIRPELPVALQQRIADHPERLGACLALAQHADCDPSILRQLADHSDWGIRREVAGRPNTPLAAVRRLAEDENERVAAIAQWHSAMGRKDRRADERQRPHRGGLLVGPSGHLLPSEVAMAAAKSYTRSVADASLQLHTTREALLGEDVGQAST